MFIDNYDSFTYNLVQYIGETGVEIEVFRNDEIDLSGIKARNPKKIVISPGPGTPEQAGISMPVVKHFAESVPILGVCLGHQAIGQVFGASVVRAPEPVHGKPSAVIHKNSGVFSGIPNPFVAGRYHSLVVANDDFPDCLQITAETEDGLIMGICHKELEIHGVQFHPESILTGEGKNILQNFLAI